MSVSAKAGDKRVTDALAGIQKALTEIHRRLGLIDPEGISTRLDSIDASLTAIITRLDTGDVDFT